MEVVVLDHLALAWLRHVATDIKSTLVRIYQHHPHPGKLHLQVAQLLADFCKYGFVSPRSCISESR
jgi:hypothetical protein